MAKPFEREPRYVVLKKSDIQECMSQPEQERLLRMSKVISDYRASIGKAPLDTFVVESDWVEFPIVIDMVRRRMEGLPTRDQEFSDRLADWQRNYGELKGQIAREHSLLLASCPETCRCEEYPVGTIQTYVAVLERQIKKMKEAIGLHLTHHEHGCAYLDDFAPDNVEYTGPDAEPERGGAGYVYAPYIPVDSTTTMQTIRDLAMLVKQLCRRITVTDPAFAVGTSPERRAKANFELAEKAMNYLKRKGLQGSPLRDDSPLPAPSDQTSEHLLQIIFQTWCYLRPYTNDADHATHAKRLLQNCIIATGTDKQRHAVAQTMLPDGQPCKHPGCAHHVTHPCEFCGRIGMRKAAPPVDMTLVVEAAMTEQEKAAFLDTFLKANPRWRGAKVADVLDTLDDRDAHLAGIEPLAEKHGAEINTPRLLRLATLAVIYITGNPEPEWEAVKAFAERVDGKALEKKKLDFPEGVITMCYWGKTNSHGARFVGCSGHAEFTGEGYPADKICPLCKRGITFNPDDPSREDVDRRPPPTPKPGPKPGVNRG